MKKSLMILAAILSVGLFGCSTESSDGLTKEEQEAIYREEVRKKLDEEAAEEAEKEAAEEPEDEPEDEPEETNGAATFDALPKGVQAAVISTFYDERATADSLVNGGMYTSYAFDEPYLIIQVTSGAGTGHPIYLLEREEDTYIPVDGVVYVGADTVESAAPSQVDVTLAELAVEYETNQTLYDQTHDPSYTWDMTLADFNEIKNQIGQAIRSGSIYRI